MDICVRPVWAEIDLDIIANNMKEIRNLVGEKEIIAVVKANAWSWSFRHSFHSFRKWCF